MTFLKDFVNPMRLSRRYQEWAKDSPGDRGRFDYYVSQIATGKRPRIPVMATHFGKALIGAGKPYLPAATPPPPPPPPPPVTISNVFEGRGAFTAHDPLMLVRKGIADRLDWVALKGDADDHAAMSDATALRNAGVKRIFVWYSWDGRIALAPGDISANGWIGQAEGPEQYNKCMSFATDNVLTFAGLPRALVTNNHMSNIPPGWVALAESYWNVVEAAEPGSAAQDSLNRGAKTAYPVFGVGHDAGVTWSEAYRVVLLATYVKAWSPTNWSAYLGEYFTVEDIAYLKAMPR